MAPEWSLSIQKKILSHFKSLTTGIWPPIRVSFPITKRLKNGTKLEKGGGKAFGSGMYTVRYSTKFVPALRSLGQKK
jgi:hypothetical protein